MRYGTPDHDLHGYDTRASRRIGADAPGQDAKSELGGVGCTPQHSDRTSIMFAVESRSSTFVSLAIWTGFSMMCVGMFMAILDVQVVATSLPTIQQALNIAPDQMSWVQTAYLIAEIIAIPLTGLLTRTLTMRWLFVAAVSTFIFASAGCAASEHFWSLIAWRIVQGFSGGTLIPAVFSAVFLLFPVRLQPLATMIAGVLAVLAPTAGPIVGGWITATYSWPWLFLINAPPGIIAASVAALSLPQERPSFDQLRRLDIITLGMGVVEDDYLVAQVLVDLLEDAGAVVIGPIGWVDEALALIADGTDRFDGAVLDVNLHGSKSYPIAEALNARSIKFIFATGYGADALDEPYRHYPRCEKPFDQTTLIAAFG